MAVHTYIAESAGYVGGEIKEAGTTFSTEFLGLKRNGKGEIERDKAGNPIMVAIPDPSWVRRISAADAVAVDAATDRTPDDINVDAMNLSEAKAYAASIGIDATALTKKDDVIAAIKAARPPAI